MRRYKVKRGINLHEEGVNPLLRGYRMENGEKQREMKRNGENGGMEELLHVHSSPWEEKNRKLLNLQRMGHP